MCAVCVRAMRAEEIVLLLVEQQQQMSFHHVSFANCTSAFYQQDNAFHRYVENTHSDMLLQIPYKISNWSWDPRARQNCSIRTRIYSVGKPGLSRAQTPVFTCLGKQKRAHATKGIFL